MEQHVIIGTAGHIDHGKTTLVRALTGRETDTLKEEKDRGISINLGFTYFDLPSGRRAGIVDVPGHEKFIKNMLAGISGIDVVLLVVAADEGIMPQTREHLNILELLDIKKGIVVITKKDLVDDEWLQMVKDDIQNELIGSFLEDAPIVPVSSSKGDNLSELIKLIDELTEVIPMRDTTSKFRIPIDRVFSVSGFGTVITGTLIAGTVNEGDSCEIYRNGESILSKIRNIQVHGDNVNAAYSGQRVAINLANVKKDEITRGDVVTAPKSLNNSMMVDCSLKYLKGVKKNLKNNDRIKFYHGTKEVIGRIVLLDKKELEPGGIGYAQIRLEEEVCVKRGDKFVIRRYSPMITIGGGTILESNPPKEKPFDKSVIEALKIKEKGEPIDIVEKIIESNSDKYLATEEIIKESGMQKGEIKEITNELVSQGKIIKIGDGDLVTYIHSNYFNIIKDKASSVLNVFHKNNPLKQGISKGEFKTRVFGQDLRQKLFDDILRVLSKDLIDVLDTIVFIKGFEIKFTKEQQVIHDSILKVIGESKFSPQKPDEIIAQFKNQEKVAKMVFASLIDSNKIIKINEEVFLLKENLEEAKELLVNFIKDNGAMTAASFRDLLGVSRKYAVAILEYFDEIKLTKRVEDKRILC